MDDPPCTYFMSLRYDQLFRAKTLRYWSQRVASVVALLNNMPSDKLCFAYFEAELMALAVWTVLRASPATPHDAVAHRLHITACRAVLCWRNCPPSPQHYHRPLSPLKSARLDRYLHTPYRRLCEADRLHLIRAVVLIRLVVYAQ